MRHVAGRYNGHRLVGFVTTIVTIPTSGRNEEEVSAALFGPLRTASVDLLGVEPRYPMYVPEPST
jgi:hypothetical protein